MTSRKEFEETVGKTIDDEIGFIVLITGQDEAGADKWYYVSISPSKYEDFLIAQQSGSYDIDDYGEVLHEGDGTEPPADIRESMEQDYNISDDFEDQYNAAIKALEDLNIPQAPSKAPKPRVKN